MEKFQQEIDAEPTYEEQVAKAKARESAYVANAEMLRGYVLDKASGVTEATAIQKAAIQTQPHTSVWKEMKRQREYYPNLRELFRQAPETLDW